MVPSLLTIGLLLLASSERALGFAPVVPRVSSTSMGIVSSSTTTTTLNLQLDPSIIVDTSSSLASSLVVAETQAWVQPLASVLDPFLNFFSFFMLCRVVLSWYPTTNVNELPWSVVVWPTEPFLRAIRNAIPPAFGVDITPIVWLGFFTFVHEIMLGQQGLLTMKIKYGI